MQRGKGNGSTFNPMIQKRIISIRLMLVLAMLASGMALSACAGVSLPQGFLPTWTKPAAHVEVTHPPSPESAINGYYAAWQQENYAILYAGLSSTSQRTISAADFEAYYSDLHTQATIRTITFQIQSLIVGDGSATATVQQTWHTIFAGDVIRGVTIPLIQESGAWKIEWDYAVVLPELAGGNRLSMMRQPAVRGTIFDRNNQPLASQAEVIAIGIMPGDITDPDKVDGRLGQIFGRTKDQIHDLYAEKDPNDYIPVGYLSTDELADNYAALSNLAGIQVHPNSTRYYAGDGIASLIVGYVGQPSAEEVAPIRALGYAGDEKIGKAGVEQWGEQYLAGRPAVQLFVIPPRGGTALQTLAQSDGEPGMAVYTAIDRDLQNRMERYLMDGFLGAAVVIRPDTGEVLAMLSNPTFDNNLFDPQNYGSAAQLTRLLGDPTLPMYNRASQGQYPLGSVFKIITMSAALSNGYKAADTYDCTSYFYDSSGHAYADWTVEHKEPAQGILTMTQALERSCDTYFYHLGFEMFHKDPWIVPNMARGFGLGKMTGIDSVPESKGFVPDPAAKEEKYGQPWQEGDAINQAIGQGELQVTPLQVVDYVAAVSNGGTLFRPHFILRVMSADGTTVLDVAPESRGTLPVSAATLADVQEGMRQVVNGTFGSGRQGMLGMRDSVKIAGKTGTATTNGEPNAWFVAYTFSGIYRDKPDIAIVVLVEHAGEGSQIAAPMARRILELYYFGRPLNKYPWEATYGVHGTATPLPTVTPTETVNPTETKKP
jgi:penicillin-binding protein 2